MLPGRVPNVGVAIGPDDEVDPAVGVGLLHEAGDVAFDRRDRQVERSGQFVIGHALTHNPKDILLSGGVNRPRLLALRDDDRCR